MKVKDVKLYTKKKKQRGQGNQISFEISESLDMNRQVIDNLVV